MFTKKPHSLFFKISTYSLAMSLALVIFSLIFGTLGSIFSFAVFQLDLKDRFLEIEPLTRLGVTLTLILIIMSLALFLAQSWLKPRVLEIEESVGEKVLVVLAIILTVVLLLIFYLIFSFLATFLVNRYWS